MRLRKAAKLYHKFKLPVTIGLVGLSMFVGQLPFSSINI